MRPSGPPFGGMSDQMSSDQPFNGTPNPSVWTNPPATPPPPAFAPVRHSYPLAVRDHGLGTAIGLLLKSLPYALAHCGILLAYALGCIIWLVITFGGAAWLGTHIAQAFGVVWFILCIVGIGWFWGAVLRYLLHLLACGHVAVLTDLITRGQVGNGTEPQLAYGKRIVIERFGQVNALYGLNMLVRGILAAFHRTLDWIAEMLPIPGLESLSNLINIVMRAATRYLDKVILSYNLARNDQDPWRGAREGIVYYCQNARPILETSIWIVIQERVLSFLLWLVLLAPAAAITVLLPHSVRESAGVVTIIIALLLAGALRASFIKPLFLIMMMVRFHTLIEHQPINQEWDTRLSSMSDKFRTMGMQASTAL
jgi:hypothetical protein